MVLACKGKAARDEWISVISDCSRITYENALLGDTMISKLQAKGSELEKENEAL